MTTACHGGLDTGSPRLMCDIVNVKEGRQQANKQGRKQTKQLESRKKASKQANRK